MTYILLKYAAQFCYPIYWNTFGNIKSFMLQAASLLGFVHVLFFFSKYLWNVNYM